MTKLTKENIEMQIMLYVDNELSAGEIRDLMAYLEKYPGYKALLRDYQYSVLQPEEMIFVHKERLIRSQGRKVFSLKVTIGIAAAVAIIFAVTGYYQWTTRNGRILLNDEMAMHKTDSSGRKQGDVAGLEKISQDHDMVPHPRKTGRVGIARSVAAAKAQPELKSPHNGGLKAIPPVSAVPMVALATQQQPVTVSVKLVNTGFGRQEQRTMQEPLTLHQSKDGLVAEQIATIYEQSDRLKGVHSLVAELDERKSRAVDAWQQIKNANVILKIGPKEIVIK